MLIVSMCFERYNVFKRPGMIVNFDAIIKVDTEG